MVTERQTADGNSQQYEKITNHVGSPIDGLMARGAPLLDDNQRSAPQSTSTTKK